MYKIRVNNNSSLQKPITEVSLEENTFYKLVHLDNINILKIKFQKSL